MLQRKETFKNQVADACRILARWKNQNGNTDSRVTEAKEGIESAMISSEEQKGIKKNDITRF